MPTINLHGVPPGGGRGGGGGGQPPSSQYTGAVSDNPARPSDYAAMQRSVRQADARREAREAETDKAYNQRDQALRREAREIAARRTAEERLFKRREQEEKRRQQELTRQTNAEIRAREQELARENRERKRRETEIKRNEAAQAALVRRQANERDARIRRETQLARQFSNLTSRASAVQSPATYRAIGRAAGSLNDRVQDFRNRYGTNPFGVGSIPGLLSGMGSFENTYTTQNVNRLGNLGARAADNRNYRELVRIEHELRRIERTSEKHLAVDSAATAEQKVNARRSIDAVKEARTKIGVARAGNSGLMNFAGNMVGTASLLMTNPYVDVALAAAGFTLGLPFLSNGVVNKVMGMSKPYTDFRQGTAALSRGGNISSLGLGGKFFQRGPATAAQKFLGLTPQDNLRLLNAYGIAPTSVLQGNALPQDIRMASFQPFMGLSDTQLAQGLKISRTLGVTRGSMESSILSAYPTENGYSTSASLTTDSDKYFEKLRKVMATATREGLDHSDVAAGFNNLLMMGARSGAANVNAGAIANFQGTLMSSGLPGMRSGEGIAATLAGMNAAVSNTGIGGAPARNTMWLSYFNRHGGPPKTAAALAQFLGWDKQTLASKMADPTQKQLIDNYLRAAQTGNGGFTLQYLQPFLQNRPDLMAKAFEGSVYGGASPLLKPLIFGNVTGSGYLGGVALQTGGAPASGGMAIRMPDSDVAAALKAAATQTGLPLGMVQGLAFSESGFNAGATNGSHVGLMQLGKEVRSDYEVPDNAKYDPRTNALVGSQYFKKMLASFPISDPDRVLHAIERYKGGGTVADIMAGKVRPEVQNEAQRAAAYMTAFENTPQNINASLANQGQSNLISGEYAFRTAGEAVGGMSGDAALTAAGAVDSAVVTAVHALDTLATAIASFAHKVSLNPDRIGGNNNIPVGAPLNVYIPDAAMPRGPLRP